MMNREQWTQLLSSHKRFFIITSLVAGIFFVLGTLYGQVRPKIESWFVLQIQDLSTKHSPIRVLPRTVELRLLPIGLTLREVQILPQPEFAKFIEPTQVLEINADLSFLQILRGQVGLSHIGITGADLKVTLPEELLESEQPSTAVDLFAIGQKIPVSEFELRDINLNVNLGARMRLQFQQLQIELDKSSREFEIAVSTESLAWTDLKSRRSARIGFEVNAQMVPKRLKILSSRLSRGGSQIELEGEVEGDMKTFDLARFQFQTTSHLEVASLQRFLIDLTSPSAAIAKSAESASSQIPPSVPLDGSIDANIRGEIDLKKPFSLDSIKASLDLSTDHFSVMRIPLGKIQAAAEWINGEFLAKQVSLQSESLKASVQSLKISRMGSADNLSFQLETDPVQAEANIQPLLQAMKLSGIPVWLQAIGTMPCRGEIWPKLALGCKGQVTASDIVIQTAFDKGSQPQGALFSTAQLASSQAEVQFTQEIFTFSLDGLTMPESRGSARGEVRYKSGYKLSFESEQIALSDLQSLSGLKLEGFAGLKGTSYGDSSGGVFEAELSVRDFFFQDYFFDRGRTEIKYQAGRLTLSGLQGTLSSSRFNGDVALDFVSASEPQLTALIRVPFFDVSHLVDLTQRTFPISIPLTGTGQGQISLNGPLDVKRMNLTLKSAIYRGQLGVEPYDQLQLDLNAKKGLISIEKANLVKAGGIISAAGSAKLDDKVDLRIQGAGLRIEETQTVGQLGLAFEGELAVDSTITGELKKPDVQLQARLTKTAIGESPVPPSTLQMRIRKTALEGQLNVFGDELSAEFVIPLEASKKLSLGLKLNQFHFAPLIGAITGPAGKKDFVGILDGQVDLQSDSGALGQATGQISLNEFSIQRGPIVLKNNGPLKLRMEKGRVKVDQFRIEGEGSTITAQSSTESNAMPVDLAINAKVDLNLLSLFTPFLEELRGYLSASLSLRGDLNQSVTTLGSAYIDKGFVKIPGLVHPFENVVGDLSFNKKKIVVNSVRSDWASGKIQGSGQINVIGSKNIPIEITGDFQKVSLNIPDKVKTNGSGTFLLRGTYFPYTLQSTYTIKDGLFAKDFGDNGTKDQIDQRRSRFLPQFLSSESFQAMDLDVNIDFTSGLAIKNSLVEGSARGQLKVRGAPNAPRLEGSLRTDPETKVVFRDNAFEVTNALVTFEDGPEVNPRLQITARTRLDERDINLMVQGTGKKPEITLTSVPPLPEAELLSLLALGVSESQQQNQMNPFAPMRPDQSVPVNQAGGAQQGNAATQQVLSNVANQLVKETAQKFGLDVQLSSGFDQTGEATQRIVAKKQFSRKFGASFSQSIGGTNQTEARLRYRLTDRFSTTLWGQSLERGELTNQTGQQAPNQNRYGLDLEYRFEFK